MEKRMGSALILVYNQLAAAQLNQILSLHSEIIIGRQGLPLRERGISVISIILEGTTDQLNALTGKLGKIQGIQVKSIMMKPLTDQEPENTPFLA